MNTDRLFLILAKEAKELTNTCLDCRMFGAANPSLDSFCESIHAGDVFAARVVETVREPVARGSRSVGCGISLAGVPGLCPTSGQTPSRRIGDRRAGRWAGQEPALYIGGSAGREQSAALLIAAARGTDPPRQCYSTLSF